MLINHDLFFILLGGGCVCDCYSHVYSRAYACGFLWKEERGGGWGGGGHTIVLVVCIVLLLHRCS